MRVLLIEDDPMIAAAIEVALRDAAYAVDHVADGETADQVLRDAQHQVVLLDLGLPRRDGISVLQRLRERGDRVPVLLITARDAPGDRVRGLDLGADDYVVKPFDMDELLARMRAVLRRHSGQASAELGNGDVTLDPATRVARRGEVSVTLTAREFALLQALLLRPGAILTRSQLEDRLYGWNEEVESSAVDFLIHGVRKKLGADLIKNIRGAGWMVGKPR
jgi:two-component system, OmpR family, response regulator